MQIVALHAIGQMRELLIEPVADMLRLDGDQVTISVEVFDSLEQAKFSVVQPLLRDFAGILPDELIHERLEPGGPTGGNLALDLFDVVLHRFLNEPGGSRTRDLRIKRSIAVYTQMLVR